MVKLIYPATAGQARKTRMEQRIRHCNQVRNRRRRPRVNEGQLLNGLLMRYFPKNLRAQSLLFPVFSSSRRIT